MSNMIEKVARAVAKAENFNYDDFTDEDHENWKNQAKAAINVIGETLQDHYWSTLQEDKEMIMFHINSVLNGE